MECSGVHTSAISMLRNVNAQTIARSQLYGACGTRENTRAKQRPLFTINRDVLREFNSLCLRFDIGASLEEHWPCVLALWPVRSVLVLRDIIVIRMRMLIF